jgi:hypothetical protein
MEAKECSECRLALAVLASVAQVPQKGKSKEGGSKEYRLVARVETWRCPNCGHEWELTAPQEK